MLKFNKRVQFIRHKLPLIIKTMTFDEYTLNIPEKIPTTIDIDPSTGSPYTKSRIKKIKKIFEANQRKIKKQAELEQKRIEEEKERKKEIEEKAKKGEFAKISLNKSLPNPKRIECFQVENFIGKRIKIFGWVDTLRTQGGIIFVLLRDGTKLDFRLQCVLEGDLSQTREAAELHTETSMLIYGTIYEDKRAEGGVELKADFYEILGKSSGKFKNIVEENANPSLVMDQRHLFLRQKKFARIFKMRSSIINSFRNKLFKDNFTEVTPPVLVETQVEGGSTLFTVDYYGKPAYLTQSSQLYLETCIFSLGKVFCILPSFRAEKTRTRRHVSEYTHLESELPFVSFDDLLNHIEDLVCSVCEDLMKSHGEIILKMNPNFKMVTKPFKRMNHSDAIKFCRENNIYKDEETKEHFEYGEDIPEGPERKMTEMIGEPILLCRFPTEIKPFYMKKCSENPTLTESVDLLIPGVGEIVGGSMREPDYQTLLDGFESKGIDPKNYYWYTDLRKYGTIEHGGYGLGIERFLCWILGRDHIRDVCLYPRFTNRCTP